jgi:hypothetical protein
VGTISAYKTDNATYFSIATTTTAAVPVAPSTTAAAEPSSPSITADSAASIAHQGSILVALVGGAMAVLAAL